MNLQDTISKHAKLFMQLLSISAVVCFILIVLHWDTSYYINTKLAVVSMLVMMMLVSIVMWGWTATVIAKVIADQQSESEMISEIIDDISEIKQVIKDVTSTNN